MIGTGDQHDAETERDPTEKQDDSAAKLHGFIWIYMDLYGFISSAKRVVYASKTWI